MAHKVKKILSPTCMEKLLAFGSTPKKYTAPIHPTSRGSYTTGQNPLPKGLRIERHEIGIKNHRIFINLKIVIEWNTLFCLKHRLQTTAVSAARVLSQTEITGTLTHLVTAVRQLKFPACPSPCQSYNN